MLANAGGSNPDSDCRLFTKCRDGAGRPPKPSGPKKLNPDAAVFDLVCQLPVNSLLQVSIGLHLCCLSNAPRGKRLDWAHGLHANDLAVTAWRRRSEEE
jgi:hypothetical protein